MNDQLDLAAADALRLARDYAAEHLDSAGVVVAVLGTHPHFERWRHAAAGMELIGHMPLHAELLEHVAVLVVGWLSALPADMRQAVATALRRKGVATVLAIDPETGALGLGLRDGQRQVEIAQRLAPQAVH